MWDENVVKEFWEYTMFCNQIKITENQPPLFLDNEAIHGREQLLTSSELHPPVTLLTAQYHP